MLTRERAKGLDMLVLGSRGYGTVRRVLPGSVSMAVMRAAPCPAVVVRAEASRSRVAPVVAT